MKLEGNTVINNGNGNEKWEKWSEKGFVCEQDYVIEQCLNDFVADLMDHYLFCLIVIKCWMKVIDSKSESVCFEQTVEERKYR